MYLKFVYFFAFLGLVLAVLKTGTFSLHLQWSATPLIHLLSVWLPLVVMVAFSIATLNVDGIRDDDKRVRILEYLRSLKYDLSASGNSSSD